MRRPRPPTMHGRPVVPHNDIATPPVVHIACPWGCRGGHQFVEQPFSCSQFHALDCVSMGGKVEGPPAINRVLPHHSPTLWGKGRALFRACEVGSNLTAGMSIVVTSKLILKLLSQFRRKAHKGKAGGYEFGFATARWDYAGRKH